MRRLALLLAVLAAAAFPPSAAAATSSIVVRCGEPREAPTDLCRMGPDGRGLRRITTDGGGLELYDAPSVSRDGSRIAFTKGLRLFAADAAAGARVDLGQGDVRTTAISPDGRRVAFTRLEEVGPERGPVPVAWVVGADGGNPTRVRAGVAGIGWLGDRLVAAVGREVCVLVADGRCERVIAREPVSGLESLAVSPDGRRIAITREREGIGLYDTASGRMLRFLTTSILTGAPSWSPDGTAVAFTDGSDTLVAPIANPAAGVQVLRRGVGAPAWGGPAGTRSPRLRMRVRLRGRRLTISGTLARGARLPLHVTFTGNTSQPFERVVHRRARRGRFVVRVRIADRYLFGCRAVVTYPGDDRYRRATAVRRPRAGICDP